MYKSKLVQHLRLLNQAELKRLLQFLKSPIYNANPRIVNFYLLVRKWYPDYRHAKLQKEKVFQQLFPDRSYDHQKLLNLMSAFTALLRQYLQVLQLEKEEHTQDQLLLRALAERPSAYPVFTKETANAHQTLEGLPYRNADFYYQKFQLNRLYFNHPETDQFNLSKVEYEEAMRQLDRSFMLDKLSFSCEVKAREKPLDEQYNIWLLPEIRAGIADYPVDNPMTGAYLAMLDLLESGNAAAYYQLKELFENNLSSFHRQQQQYLLQSLINYTIKQGNSGDGGFVFENLQLYQLGLRHALLLEHQRLNDMTYISIVNVALRAKEIAWCQKFIEDYAPYLPVHNRKDAKALATALWHYANRQPEMATKLLQEVSFLNIYYQIQARVLLIKIFVEAGLQGEDHTELILAQADAFERYLRRNDKVAKGQKEALLNFAFYIKKISKLRLEPTFPQLKAELRKEMEQRNALYNKAWLLHLLI